jgi:hypothetical protein
MAKTAHEADDGQVSLDFDEEPQEVVVPEETSEEQEASSESVVETAVEEDEVSQQSKKVQKRINQLTKRAKEAEREREEAFRYAQAVQQESQNLKSRMNNLDKNYIDEYGSRVMAEQQQAQEELKKAMEMGDADASVAAQTKISQLAVAADRHQQAKAQRERQQASVPSPTPAPNVAQPPPPQMAQPAPSQEPDPKAEAWAENNAWFGDDYTMTFAAFGLHKKMVEEEGFDPKSDDYYDELDSRMREEFPHKFNEEESTTTAPRRNAQTVASVSRSSSSGRGKKVRLSPSQVTIAKRLGVPLEEYARYVKE